MIENLTEILQIAKNIAKKAHEGQFRYDGKTPFITHPETVASSWNFGGVLANQENKIVSWLHDVVEDSTVTYGDLLNQGIPFYLVAIVEILTHRKDEEYLDYILRVKENLFTLS